MTGEGRVQEPDPRSVHAAVTGDLAALEELVRLYQEPIMRFLRHLLGDVASAEDVAQETFVRAFRSLGGFRFGSRFSTWLFQIARNAAVDELRRRQRRGRLEAVAPLPSPGSAPEARAELRAALASLPERLREPLVLVEVFGFSYAEAAGLLHVPTGTVKSRVFDARTRLRDWGRAREGGAAGEV